MGPFRLPWVTAFDSTACNYTTMQSYRATCHNPFVTRSSYPGIHGGLRPIVTLLRVAISRVLSVAVRNATRFLRLSVCSCKANGQSVVMVSPQGHPCHRFGSCTGLGESDWLSIASKDSHPTTAPVFQTHPCSWVGDACRPATSTMPLHRHTGP